MSGPSSPSMQDALIVWFEANRADLPWRGAERDPYAVWVSEIMLQQTQVTTVIPYFKRFMARFPTVAALAIAPLDDVLKSWEGLGYYSRGRNLHRAAQMVMAEFGGVIPDTAEGLRLLPGIGAYTAGAIASLAYGRDTALLDGNLIRVFTRLYDITEDVTDSATRNRLWELARELVPEGRAALWNEGLMELGRLVCKPKSPDCDTCPLYSHCLAVRRGTQAERPVKKARKALPHFDVTAAVIRDEEGRLLIAQRPLNGMLGGLWEFPGGKREPGESLEACLQREIDEELGIRIAVGQPITTVRHAYTHFKITLYAFSCTLLEGQPQAIGCLDWCWAAPDQLVAYAFPSTDQKIIAALSNGGQPAMDLGL